MIDAATRAFVFRRAGNRCEYCHLPQDGYEATFHVDHIIASQHGHDDGTNNLALCCPKCNRRKGSNLSGVDPITKSIVPPLHLRKDVWADHFNWSGVVVTGMTPNARATIAVLDLNADSRLLLRRALADER